MSIHSTALIAALLCVVPPAFGAVESSYEAMVLAEIAHHRQMEIEEKKIEVLARLEEMSSSKIENNSYSNSSSYSRSKSKSKISSEQSTEVS